MQIESWIAWLAIEFIVLLLIIIGLIMVFWIRDGKKYKQKVILLSQKLKKKSALLKEAKANSSDAPTVDEESYIQQIDALKEQLLNEMNNPFLQEKIDALIAEIEDLREITDKVGPLHQEIEELKAKAGNTE